MIVLAFAIGKVESVFVIVMMIGNTTVISYDHSSSVITRVSGRYFANVRRKSNEG